MKLPWTHAELAELKRSMGKRLESTEAERVNVRPLPPLSEQEAHDLLNSIIDRAFDRALDSDECFLHGQALACYRMAIEVRMLGREGRYFVLSEADIERAAKKAATDE